MKITRLYLGDYGIFQNESVEDLSPELVVIGGGNRSGKTTLMSAMRSLGYGVSRRLGVPPSVRQHEIRADVEREGHRYSIFVDGYAHPQVAPVDGAPTLTIEELFNHLDRFTYSQVFTISLDELRQLPENIEGEEQHKISTVLLGAGWKDALQLQQLQYELNREAEQIGGKSGRVDVKQFKEFYAKIEEGINLRDQANAEMDTYEEKCSRLEQLQTDLIPALEERIEEEETEYQRLELIKEHFDRITQYNLNKQELEASQNKHLLEHYPERGREQAETLKGKYLEALESEKEAEHKFSSAAGCAPGADLQAELLSSAAELDEYAALLSGWKARAETVLKERKELEQRKKALFREVSELFGDAVENKGLELVNSVKADRVSEQYLRSIAKKYSSLEEEHRSKKKDLSDLEPLLAEKYNQLDRLPPSSNTLKKVAWMVAAGAAATVLSGSFLAVSIGLAVGALAGAGILAYFLRQHSIEQEKNKQFFELDREIKKLETDKRAFITREEEIRTELEEIEGEIFNLKRECGIPAAVEIPFLVDFIKRVRDLKREYSQLSSKEKEFAASEQDLSQELSPALHLLMRLGLYGEIPADILQDTEDIFRQLEKSFSYLKAARELEKAASYRRELEENILELLSREEFAVHEKIKRQTPLQMLEDFILRGEKFEALREKEEENKMLRRVIESHINKDRWRELLRESPAQQSISNEELLAIFDSWCKEFASAEEVRDKQARTEERIKELKDELQELMDEKRDLARGIEELASDIKLFEAKQKIEDAKKGMYKLLEQYTVRRIAAFMLEKVNERMMERTRASLLAPAGEIFNRITGKFYNSIELPPGTTHPDFKALLQDGREQSLEALSRATREQLFFSVRLSRIRDIKPELPVILDDTFANFDPFHTREAVKYLLELSRTHQVFVLTCHPEFLDCLEEAGGSPTCQFWGLQEGKFTGPYNESNEVKRLLSGT